ncbi:MAG: site-specific DNA-methyltransferase [Rickettsiales bacterium]|jgi:adenine-specific DNA-methyltransferase|nr:site-specific DNA-methyltransferase [Rickettsiales bacterium]
MHIYPIDKNGIERKWRYARQSIDSVKNLLRCKFTKNGYQIELGKNYGTYLSVWQGARYDSNEYGKKLINSLALTASFDFPKSIWNVYDCIYTVVGEKKNAVILDFFAGSGTTGHAVLELNKEDNGDRKFILCTNNENNIATDICQPRIKKVIEGYNKNGDGDFVKGLAHSSLVGRGVDLSANSDFNYKTGALTFKLPTNVEIASKKFIHYSENNC